MSLSEFEARAKEADEKIALLEKRIQSLEGGSKKESYWYKSTTKRWKRNYFGILK